MRVEDRFSQVNIFNPLVREGLDHMDQGITIFDRDLKLVAWNRRFLDLLRFPPRLAFEGADFESFIRYNAENGEYGEGDADRHVAVRVQEARRFQPHDFERRAPDGTFLRVVGTPLPAGGFVTVYTDVTENHNRQEELERQVAERTRRLALSEARLQVIADEVPAGIAHVDTDMRILYANRRFAAAYGRTPAQIIGKSCDDVLHPNTMRESRRFFEPTRRGAVLDFEMRIQLPNGKYRDIRTFLRPEGASDGEVNGFYLLSVDVTRRKAANEALMQSHKMDALGRLSSGISHDFNNLLAIILGNLVPLSDHVEDAELRKEYLEPAIAAARRGSSLTRRLLALARTEPVDPKPTQVASSISELVKLLRSSLPKTVELEYRREDEVPMGLIDPAQLEMALLNLVVNARDAISDKGRIIFTLDTYRLTPSKAEIHKLASGTYLRIRVADNGVGISPDQRERIFEPFYTSKRESGGTGLGLSMVFSFVKQSNGAIWLDSEKGRGARFTMLLPALSPDAQVQAERADIEPVTDHTENRAQLVLLVEDDDEVRTVVRRQLVDLGYPLIEAENAQAALEVLDTVREIDLVLSDISMPGEMDGIALAKHLHRAAPEVGIVLMSGEMDGTEATLTEANCPFIEKPFDSSDLGNALLKAVRFEAETARKPS
ncbi:PAS-domain containing protein [Sedimentitalea sp. HM32M-2]|uniref:hybrid sensor histidine kinase/response regulator n=1 Tax=Sedimentitalea sp. HM32M-2 TaxID=3351566 RepID=UPI00362F9BAA